MGIKRTQIIALATRNSPDDGGTTQNISIKTGNAGNSTSGDGGYSGDILLQTGLGGATTATGYHGRDSGDIRLVVGDAGNGDYGGDGGQIRIQGGDGGDADVGSNGDGGVGTTIRIEAGYGGDGDGTGSDGIDGLIELVTWNALALAAEGGGNQYILSGVGGTPFYHRGAMSINDSGTPATLGTSVAMDFRGTDKAPLFPRMTTTQRDAMTPLNGMIIYNTTNGTHESYKGGSWVPFPATGSGGGEANTASNAGSGTAITYQKVGVDLQFNAIKSETSRLTVALDSGTHDIELTVNESDLLHDDVAGEFAGVTLKATPTSSDIILIEDAADSNNKKRITIGSLSSGGVETRTLTVPSDVAVGDLVYVTGSDTADKADNTAVSTSESIGVVINKPTTVSADVKFYGLISGLSGMTPGYSQFLGIEGGIIESSLPTTVGYVIKKIGVAITSSVLLFAPKQGITL